MFSVKKMLLLSALSISFVALCPPNEMQIDSMESAAKAERDPEARRVLQQRARMMKSDAEGKSAPVFKTTNPLAQRAGQTDPTAPNPAKKATPKRKTGLVEQGKRLIQAAKNKWGSGKK
jgi:hypothetical protein